MYNNDIYICVCVYNNIYIFIYKNKHEIVKEKTLKF